MILRLIVLLYTIWATLSIWTTRAVFAYLLPILFWLWFSWMSTDRSEHRRSFRWYTYLIFNAYYAFWIYWYLLVGSQSSQDAWIWRIAESPVGRSSCCRTPDQSRYVYHPAGYFDCSLGDVLYQNLTFNAVTFCPLRNARWADATNVRPQEYMKDPLTYETDLTRPCSNSLDPTCDHMVSEKPEDWPDLGKGILGKYRDIPLVNTKLCMGNSNMKNSMGQMGLGKPLCSSCNPHPPPECRKYRSQALCFACPGDWPFYEGPPSSEELRRSAEFGIGLVILTTVAAFVSGMRKTGYSYLF